MRKLFKMGLSALGIILLAVLANQAIADCVNSPLSTATLFLNKTALATMKGQGNLPSADQNGKRFIYLNNFYSDNQFTYPPGGGNGACSFPHVAPMLCNDTPTNPQGLIAGTYPTSHTKTLPIICSLNGNPSYQEGNVESNWNDSFDGGVIGLGGALKIRSDFQNPTLSLRWGKFYLINTVLGNPGVWLLADEYGTLFELYNVQKKILDEAVAPHKQTLLLTGDLKFGNSDWGDFLAQPDLDVTPSERQRKLGTISVNFEYWQ